MTGSSDFDAESRFEVEDVCVAFAYCARQFDLDLTQLALTAHRIAIEQLCLESQFDLKSHCAASTAERFAQQV